MVGFFVIESVLGELKHLLVDPVQAAELVCRDCLLNSIQVRCDVLFVYKLHQGEVVNLLGDILTLTLINRLPAGVQLEKLQHLVK